MKYNKVDPGSKETYNKLTISSNLKYHCTYTVNTGLIKDPDVNVIYRTISLNDPFPGESGKGRPAGSNWQGTTRVLGNEMSFISAYIENNRGVKTEKVYNETPMYEFVLTASNMRAIRKYNKSVKNNYTDFNFECTNGEYCKSKFLESGISNGYFKFTSDNSFGGACFNANVTNWESCRYSNIGG